MDDVRGQAQRVASEASRRTAAVTEANQRVINDFVGLSMEAFYQSARLWMQIQQNAVDMMLASQAAVLRAQMAWPDAFRNPLRWYQSVCQESVEGARKAFDAVNEASRMKDAA